MGNDEGHQHDKNTLQPTNLSHPLIGSPILRVKGAWSLTLRRGQSAGAMDPLCWARGAGETDPLCWAR